MIDGARQPAGKKFSSTREMSHNAPPKVGLELVAATSTTGAQEALLRQHQSVNSQRMRGGCFGQ